jgi:MFS family permease
MTTRSVLDDWVLALPAAGAFGFTYFMTATALASVMQRNLADEQRSAAMPLWFMAFGGTVPLGNLAFGPLMDAVGARWVLAIGAVSAVALAWWSDLKRLDEDDFLPKDVGGEPFRPVNANRLF